MFLNEVHYLSQLCKSLVPHFKFPAIPILLLILVLPACTVRADEAILEVLNPVASMEVKQVVPVPRPTTLDNKRILLYYNGKINSNVAVEEVQKQLEKRVAGSKFKIIAGSAWGPGKGFYDEIVAWKPDAVISSTAD